MKFLVNPFLSQDVHSSVDPDQKVLLFLAIIIPLQAIISPVLSDTNISDKFMLKSSVKNIFISSGKVLQYIHKRFTKSLVLRLYKHLIMVNIKSMTKLYLKTPAFINVPKP
jgi:hypothetical protein